MPDNPYRTPHAGCVCPEGYVRDTINGHPSADCPFHGLYGLELAQAHLAADEAAGRGEPAPSCATMDLDRMTAEAAEHVKRQVRARIARADRLIGQAADLNELEGHRVECLSYRDQLPPADAGEAWKIARERLGAAALKLRNETNVRRGTTTAGRDATPPAPTVCELLAHQADGPALTDCAKGCGQLVYGDATVCQACRDLEAAPQGDQLGLFVAPRTTKAPQSESLFTTAPTGALF